MDEAGKPQNCQIDIREEESIDIPVRHAGIVG
jgi:hypothetical protein